MFISLYVYKLICLSIISTIFLNVQYDYLSTTTCLQYTIYITYLYEPIIYEPMNIQSATNHIIYRRPTVADFPNNLTIIGTPISRWMNIRND